jgi:hypothetical protein
MFLKIHMLKSFHHGMVVLGGGAFWEEIRQWGGALMCGTDAF